MNELDVVRVLRAEVPTPTAAHLAAPRGRLLEAIEASPRSRPPRRNRLRWVLPVAAIVAALAIAVIEIPRPASKPRTVVPAPHISMAAQVLEAAALHAAAEPATRPSPDQWIYSKAVEQQYGSATTTDENWIQFDGVKTAYWQDGQLDVHTGPTPAAPHSVGSALQAYDAAATPMTAYDALVSLPSDPAALLAAVDGQVAADPGSVAPAGGSPIAHSSRRQLEFQYLSQLLWNAAQAAPASAEAAVFKAMATIPGVSAQSGVTDAAGRPAIALADEGDEQQLLFDPQTYQVAGLRTVSDGSWPASPVAATSKTLPNGTVVDSIAFASVAFVNQPGARRAQTR